MLRIMMSIDTVSSSKSCCSDLSTYSQGDGVATLYPRHLFVDSVAIRIRADTGGGFETFTLTLGGGLGGRDLEVNVFPSDSTTLSVGRSMDVVLLHQSFLLVGSKLGHLFGDQCGSSVGQVGTSEDEVDLGKLTTAGLRIKQPYKGKSDCVLHCEQAAIGMG